MANPFQLDDRVILKTGGEPMMVESVRGDKVSCAWMATGGTDGGCSFYRKEATFSASDLVSWIPKSAK